VFTSIELAQQGVAQFTGSTDGWQAHTYSADEFVKHLSETNPPFMLLNPGTQLQHPFSVQELVEHCGPPVTRSACLVSGVDPSRPA
jgi:hypothetical protein